MEFLQVRGMKACLPTLTQVMESPVSVDVVQQSSNG